MKRQLNRCLLGVITVLGLLFLFGTNASADATRNLIGDFSSYQGSTPSYMQQFTNRGMKGAIVKTGGHGGGEGYHYQNPKASAQLASASKLGLNVGTYFWGQFGGSQSDAKLSAQMAVNDAQRVGLKKGSLIALDYEEGASYSKSANTQAIFTFGDYVKSHGYKFALYTGSSYLKNYIDINAYGKRYGTSIWIANYKTMSLQTRPDFNWFPSFPYIAMWQFGSNWYGIDGSVDLVDFMGKTSGDVRNNTPVKPVTPNKSNQTNAKNTTYKVVSGDSWWGIANRVGLDMYQLAKLNGKTINSVIHPGQVLKIKGTIKNNAKPIKQSSQTASNASYVVKPGDSWWSIATNHGMSMYNLAMINGKSISSTIYPGQRLVIKKGAKQVQRIAGRYRIVKRGDTLQYLSYLTGYSVNYLVNKNGIADKNSIYVGQRIYY